MNDINGINAWLQRVDDKFESLTPNQVRSEIRDIDDELSKLRSHIPDLDYNRAKQDLTRLKLLLSERDRPGYYFG